MRSAHAGLALALALAAALTAVRWHQDWNGSEGTYALTARSLLNGGDLYGHTVVAQPPALFVLGAGVLALGDSLDLLRVVMVVLQVVALALLALAVRRMTGSWWATAATAPIGVVLPWSVHEQGIFQPEALALPCLAGALVLAPGRRGAGWAGVLLALAVGAKLPMALPALAGVWAAADRRAAAGGFVATGAVLAIASLAAFGSGVADDAVVAQLDVGRHGLRYLAEMGVQGAWNLAPLVLGVAAAAVAWRRGWRPPDRAQWRVAVALAAGTALTLASTTKVGTSLTVMPPVEAMLLPVAVAGAVAWTDDISVFRGAALRRRLVAVAAVAFLLAQSLSLVAQPRRGGAIFLRPLSAPAWNVRLTGPEVDAHVSALSNCPPSQPSGDGTVVTFRAGRRMPGDQPDVFLPEHAHRLAGVAREVAADRRRCP
ncbi:MAG TPA: hypothetical protein VGM33_22350 [Baekduia sp.]